jgi:hypothetical protein
MKALCIILLIVTSEISAQIPVDTTAIKVQLEHIRERDQKTRTGLDSVDHVQQIDSSNLLQLEKIVAQYGWPGISFVGARGNNTAFLVIQHAELTTQLAYFPMIQQSVNDGESNPADLAMLEDRICMRQGKPQKYGSQVVSDPATGGWKFWEIADEAHVNERRAAVGLMPIETYATYFGITYTSPTKAP